jgi:4-nitrophenyl phosphatase
LRSAGIDVIEPAAPAERVEAVFTGWFREFTFPDLEAACRDLWAGALATTASDVPFFAARGGRALGVSFAINTMLHAFTRKRARVLGKPSREALQCALQGMGLPAVALRDIAVVGDDPKLEVRMARAAGALGVAVTTGLEDRAALEAHEGAGRADLVVDGLNPLIEILR